MDPKEMKVAGMHIQSLIRVLEKVATDPMVQHAIQSCLREDEHFLSRAELVISFSKSPNEHEVITVLAQGMEKLRGAVRPDQYRYGRSDDDKLKDAEQRWRRLLVDAKKCPICGCLIPLLDEFADTSFHHHRQLAKCSTRLATVLERLLPQHASIVVLCFQLARVRRIHRAGLRYTWRILRHEIRSQFLNALRAADSQVAAAVETEHPVDDAENGPVFDPDVTMREAYDPDARIWPKNNAIVVKLAQPLISADSSFTQFAQHEWKRDEDALSERLVSFLHKELEHHKNDPDVHRWIRDQGLYGGLHVSEPYVRDREPEMGADIALIVEYSVKDLLKHTWAYLLQAKKSKGPSGHPTRWDIDRGQLEDLLLRTRAGFYLLYTPEPDSYGCYVVPAQTVESTLRAVEEMRSSDKEAKSIPYISGKSLGKPWNAFLLEDVFGAWSGEPDEELAALAREGTLARVVFEVRFTAGPG